MDNLTQKEKEAVYILETELMDILVELEFAHQLMGHVASMFQWNTLEGVLDNIKENYRLKNYFPEMTNDYIRRARKNLRSLIDISEAPLRETKNRELEHDKRPSQTDDKKQP